MSTFPEQVTLHEKTVKQIASEAASQVTILVEDKLVEPRAPKPGEVQYSIKVLPEMWKWALATAEGNAKRIQIISDTEVIVHNKPWRS